MLFRYLFPCLCYYSSFQGSLAFVARFLNLATIQLRHETRLEHWAGMYKVSLMVRKPSGRTVGIVAAVVAILLLAYFPIRNHAKFERAIIAQTHGQLLTTARSIATSIHDHIEILSRSLKIISENAEIQQTLKNWDPKHPKFRSSMPGNIFKAHEGHADVLYILNARGDLVYRHPPDKRYHAGTLNLADRADVAHVLELKLPYISDPFRNRAGELVITTSEPIFERAGGGEFVGIARWLIKIDSIAADFVAKVSVGESGYAQLVDANGQLLATPDAGQIGRHILDQPKLLDPARDWSPLKRIAADVAAGKEGTDLIDTVGVQKGRSESAIARKLIAYTPVPFDDHTWSVLMTLDYSEVSAPIFESARENLLFFCGVIGIITLAGWKHLQMQKQLTIKEGDRQLITFLETLPIGIFVITPEGKPFYANTAAEKILGRIDRDGPEIDILSLFTDTYQSGTGNRYPRDRMPLLKALAGEKASAGDMEIRKEDRVVPIELHGYPIHADNGELRFVVGAFLDITERRKAEREISSAQQRLALHAQQTPLGVIEWDMNFRVAEWNKASERIFGYPREESLGRHASFIIPEAMRPHVDTVWKELCAGTGGRRSTNQNVTKDDRVITCEWYNTPLIDGNGGVIGVASLVQDITERIKMEHSIIQARQDWEDTFSMISDSITIHDNDYNIVSANRAAKETLKLSAVPASPAKCYKHYHGMSHPPGDCPSCKCAGSDKEITSEIFEPHLNRFIEVRAIPRIDREGVRKGIIHVVRDISDRKRMEDELRHRALYDSLTKLPNRMLFLDRLKNLFAHQKRQKDLLFAVLFIDLDHFKKINDTAGHTVGDLLLVAVAERLKNSTRPGDTISRFGGDEFLVIVDSLKDVGDAIATAERIQEGLGHTFSIEGSEIYITASIGIALSGVECGTADDLIRNADLAMYNAKANGRSSYALFDRSMHSTVLESVKMENDLRNALKRQEFIIHYQPIIDAGRGTASGFEALVRWQHPVDGLLLPGEFITIAEETGMIGAIGEWAILSACHQMQVWRQRYPERTDLYVSVNVSAKLFSEQFPDIIESILKETGIAPRALRIEITETLLMEHTVVAHEVLTRLRAMDVPIYLDDFGTGYSSLSYLHKFPIDALKIDRTFVMNIVRDRQAQEIIKAIAMLAKSLNLIIIVEGVETTDQLQFFRGLNCNLVQGFLFSKAVEHREAESFITTRTNADL